MNLPAGFPTESIDIVIGSESLEDTGEHILIADDAGVDDPQPRTVANRTVIEDTLGGTRTDILLYDEGFVRLRQGTRKRMLKDHLCELHFVDPDFDTERRVAARWLWSALAAVGGAASCWLLLPHAGLGKVAIYIVVALLALSAVLLRVGLLRSVEEHLFATTTGRAVVLRLTAHFGCFRRVRLAAQDIANAIRLAGGDVGSAGVHDLRAEMRAHYRLLERGVISKETCSKGTRQILARFG